MSLGSRALKIVLLVLETIGCGIAYFSSGYHVLVLLPPLLFLLLMKKPHVVLMSTMYYSFVLVVLVTGFTAYLIAIPLAFLITVYFVLYSNVQDVLKPVYTLLLVLAPLYVFSAKTIPVALASAISLSTLLLFEYYRLGRSKVIVFLLNPTTFLNDYVNVAINIECPGLYTYSVFVDGELCCSKSGTNSSLDNIRIQAKKLGLNKHSIRVIIQDLRKLAKVEHGPYLVEYTVLPKFAELYKRAENILALYSKYISPPLITKLEIHAVPAPIDALKDLLIPKTGVTASATLPLSTTTPGGKYHSEEAGLRSIGNFESLEKSTWIPGTPVKTTRLYTKAQYEVRITWKIPHKLVERVIQVVKGYLGEYLGVREYTPGDSLRLIHWKKSLRRSDIVDLVIKVYSSSDVDKHVRPQRSIVIADLTATSLAELDLLLQTLYSHILSAVKREKPPTTPIEFYLYITTPRGETYFLKGKALDVLLGLNTIIQEEKLTTIYDYSSWHRLYPPPAHVPGKGVLSELVGYYEAYGSALIGELKSQGIKRGSVTLIHSRALGFKYYIVSSVLSKNGFATVFGF